MFHIGSWQRRWLANEADATANGLADIPGWSAKIQEDCDAVRAGLRKELVAEFAKRPIGLTAQEIEGLVFPLQRAARIACGQKEWLLSATQLEAP